MCFTAGDKSCLMKNRLLVKINDLLQLPRESPQVRNSDGIREQVSGSYFKPKPFYSYFQVQP